MTRQKLSPLWRRLALAALAVLLACSVLITVVDGRGLPSWQDIYAVFGYQYAAVPTNRLRVTVLDVGEADCILLQSGDTAVMIDAGESSNGADIVMVLEQHGIRQLHAIVITHADSDHIGAIDDVLRAVEVDAVYTPFVHPDYTPQTNAYADMTAALKEQQVPLRDADYGTGIAIGKALLTVISESTLLSDGENRSSAVCRVTFGKHRFLFTGDADAALEKALLRRGVELQADVLKVAHHGAGESTTASFLKAVSPSYAVISCGLGNAYGHPHTDTVNRLTAAGAAVYRTDLHGTVVFESDGTQLTVYTEYQ